MPWFSDGQFWVGKHDSQGLVVVSKSGFTSEAFIDVFLVEQDRVARCNRVVMRERTKGVGVSDAEAEYAISRLLSLQERDLEAKNRVFLERRGKAFAGTRKRSDLQPPRSTHCWYCKQSLDSTIDLECIGCGWILCSCGACGCAREAP